MAINALHEAKGIAQPIVACNLCLKFPLRLLRDGSTVVCEYCDAPGNPMPPPGGFLDEYEAEDTDREQGVDGE